MGINRRGLALRCVRGALLAGFAMAVSIAMGGPLEPMQYPNPLIPQRADPFIVRHTDGMYYFTASVPEYDRIELRGAKTIAGLAGKFPTATQAAKSRLDFCC